MIFNLTNGDKSVMLYGSDNAYIPELEAEFKSKYTDGANFENFIGWLVTRKEFTRAVVVSHTYK